MKEPLRRIGLAPALHEDLEHIAVPVDCPPQISPAKFASLLEAERQGSICGYGSLFTQYVPLSMRTSLGPTGLSSPTATCPTAIA